MEKNEKQELKRYCLELALRSNGLSVNSEKLIKEAKILYDYLKK